MLEKTIQILTVEDNPGDARLIEEFLKQSNLRSKVSFVEDGDQALDFLMKQGEFADAPTPDLILLDLNLPKRDGRSLLKVIKEHPELRKIPVLILTTSSSRYDIYKSYELQANCYISKPADLASFNAVMKSIEAFWFSVVELPNSSSLLTG